MEQLLTVNDLNKSYKKSEFQLSNISFSIDPQEVVGLIGKNGSGKSTLINTLVVIALKIVAVSNFLTRTYLKIIIIIKNI